MEAEQAIRAQLDQELASGGRGMTQEDRAARVAQAEQAIAQQQQFFEDEKQRQLRSSRPRRRSAAAHGPSGTRSSRQRR